MSLIIKHRPQQWDEPIDPETYEGHDDTDSLEEPPYLDIEAEIRRGKRIQETFEFAN